MINDCSELFDILKLETLPLTKSQISLKFYNLKKENLEKQIIEYIYDRSQSDITRLWSCR